MTFGLTDSGFALKRLDDCKAELDAAYRSAFGQGIKTSPDTVFGKLIALHADREAQLWELAQAIYDAMYPNSASGLSLANIGQFTNIVPNPATRSTVTLYLAGTDGVVVPANSKVAVLSSGDQFQTSAATILSGSQIAISSITRSGSTATAASTGHGRAANSWLFVSGADQDEYNGLVQLLTVAADSFTYAVSGTPVSPATGTILGDPATPAVSQSVDTGPVSGIAGTITEIVNPVVGWDRAQNALDAVLGADAESDAAFRERRLESLAGLGAGTQPAIKSALLAVDGVTNVAVFVNDGDTTDADYRPPHSVECLVVGGADQDIWDAIWRKKAGGIETYGTEVGTITDSQGETQTVKFSRAAAVDIYLHLDLTVDEDVFPANGQLAVEEAILAWASSLELGQDVVVYPTLMSVIGQVAGITDVVVKIGTAPDPTLDNNVVIGPGEIAAFDSTRIVILIPT